MNAITIVNILVVVVMIAFTISGYKEGFFRKLCGILSFFLIGFLSWYASGILSRLLLLYPKHEISMLDQLFYDTLNRITLFVVIFLLLQLVVLILRPITKVWNHIPVLSIFNRIGGCFLGLIQALLLLCLISMGLRLSLWDKGSALVSDSYLHYSDTFANVLLFYTKEPVEELQKIDASLNQSEALTKEEAKRLYEWLLDKHINKEDADKIIAMLRVE